MNLFIKKSLCLLFTAPWNFFMKFLQCNLENSVMDPTLTCLYPLYSFPMSTVSIIFL